MSLSVNSHYWQANGLIESAENISGAEVSSAGLDMPSTFDILYKSDVWICDTGASSHSTNNYTGATNERECGSSSLGHMGSAVKASKTIDLPGQFVSRDGTGGLKATLTDVNFNK